MRKAAIALAIGILVAVTAWLAGLVAGLFGVHAELWPMLMAAAVIGLLGHGKQAIASFYVQFAVGILAAFVFVLCEEALAPSLGTVGVLGSLAVIVAIVVGLGFVLPKWVGGAAFISFCAAMIVTTNIFELTLARLAVLVIGATVFLVAEHYIVKLLMPAPKAE